MKHIFEQSKNMKIRWGEIQNVYWVGGEAQISVLILFQWLLLMYEVQCFLYAKQLRLSAFLCSSSTEQYCALLTICP
jgi:hypothetical protein